MTTEMFGAPYGIQQAEKEINQNALSGLKAMQLLGAIAEQPAQKALLEAHARLYGAQASKAEADAAETAGFNKLAAGFSASQPGGQDFVGPMQPGGESTGSRADPLLQLWTIAAKAGFLKQGAALLDKGTLIMEHEAQTASAKVLAQSRALDLQRKQLELAGSAAASVQDQSTYDAMRMSLAAQGRDTSWMPSRYEEARPLLDFTVAQSMKAQDTIKMKMEQLKADSLIQRRKVENAVSSARIEELGASTELKRTRKTAIEKNGGDGTPLAQESRRALIDSRRATQAATEAKLYPPLGSAAVKDSKLRVIGQTYTLPKGRFTWNGQGWLPFKGTKAPAGASEAESADEDSSEDGEE